MLVVAVAFNLKAQVLPAWIVSVVLPVKHYRPQQRESPGEANEIYKLTVTYRFANVEMKSAPAAVAVALLLACLGAQMARAAEEQDTLVYTQDFLFSKINKAILNLPAAVQRAKEGSLKKSPASPPKQVFVSCLNSIAPEPLNWKMWCPNSHANITQWVDDVGATHRKIVLKPIANMTAMMAVWFMTPSFPHDMEVNGKVFTKNILWHPLDHGEKLDFKLQPGVPPTLATRLNETYRPASTQKVPKVYYTDLWVAAQDLALNLPRNRYVLGMEYLGLQPFTLVVEFTDTSEGLVTSVEVIIGIAAIGYDKKNPLKGAPKPVAATANALLFEQIMEPYKKNWDYKNALDAVSRHVVEEFGNLQWFVPLAWERSVQGKVLKELSDWKSAIIAATSGRLTVGDSATVPELDATLSA